MVANKVSFSHFSKNPKGANRQFLPDMFASCQLRSLQYLLTVQEHIET